MKKNKPSLSDLFLSETSLDPFFGLKTGVKKLASPLLLTLMAFCLETPLSAGSYTVTNTNTTGAGSLRQAILDANADVTTSTITVTTTGTLTLTADLPLITAQNLTINGGTNFTVNGNALFQGFIVGSQPLSSSTFTLQNIHLLNTKSIGGAGGTGSGGGGGGAGVGGGLLVAPGSQVALSNVSFQSCSAIGGKGGNAVAVSATGTGGGAGGGVGGAGGNGSATNGGGGGGGGLGFAGGSAATGGGGGGGASDANIGLPSASGTGGNGGNSFTAGTGGLGGSATTASNGGNGTGNGGGGGGGIGVTGSGNGGNSGVGGGGGGNINTSTVGSGGSGTDSFGGGGGGSGRGGASAVSTGGNGGTGGNYGGGGGGGGPNGGNTGSGTSLNGGNGGFGGGGGGAGGKGTQVNAGGSLDGGFGGQGGGSTTTTVSTGGGGGGGAGMGGAIFFDGFSNNLTLSITDGGFTTNTVAGGALGTGISGANGTAGQAIGQDIFITSGTLANINFSTTSALTIQEIGGDQGTRGVTGGGVTVNGLGTLTLPGINTYSGDTTINPNATVAISADTGLGSTTFGSGRVILQNNSTLQINGTTSTNRQFVLSGEGTVNVPSGTDVYTMNGQITGTGSLRVTAPLSGTVVLTNNSNSYMGTQIGPSAILQIANDSQLGAASTSIRFLSGGTGNLRITSPITTNRPIILNGNGNIIGGGTTTLTGLISGPGGLLWFGAETLVISGTNTFTGGLTLNAPLHISGVNPLGSGTFTVLGGPVEFIGNTTLSQPTLLSNALTYQFISDPATTTGITGAISGQGLLALSGSGNLAITPTTANSYTGGTTLTSTNLSSSGTNPFGTGLFTYNSGSLTLVGNGTYANNFAFANNLNLIANPATTSTFAGTLSGAGVLTLTGGGILQLTANNSGYASGINLNAGTLQVDNNNALGTGTMTFGGGILELVGSGDTYSNPFAMGAAGGTVILDTLSSNTFSNTISGTGAMSIQSTVSNPGTLTLSGNSGAFTGGFNVNNASLNISTVNNVGTGPLSFDGVTLGISGSSTFANTMTLGSGGLALNAVGTPNTFSGPIGGSGGLTLTGPGTVVLSGTNGYSGGTTLTSGILQVQTASNIGSGPLTFNGGSLDITGSSTFNNNVVFLTAGTITTDPGTTSTLAGSLTGIGGFTKAGTGTLKVAQTAPHTYSGGTTVAAGILQAQGTNPLGSGAITFNGGALELTGNSSFTNNISLLASETLIADAGTTSTFSGSTTGLLGLTKQGTGTAVFTGTNSYSGPTLVTAGAVFENGTLLNSATTVSAGATFGGNGTVSTIDVFGTLMPGFPTGTLTSGSVIFEPGSTFIPLAQDSLTSALASSGNVSILPGSKLLPNLNPFFEREYTIITTTGLVTGQFLPPDIGTPRFAISVDYFPQSVVLDIDLIPFADILPKGNLRNIAVCFDAASMNTSSDMSAVLAILNNLSLPEMAAAFHQFDPAFYNALPFAEEAVTERVRRAYTSHAYERDYDVAFEYSLWTSLFANRIIQDGIDVNGDLGYDDRIAGIVTGMDGFLWDNTLVTGGFSYARSRVKWREQDAISHLNSYTGLIAATWYGYPFTADVYGSYTYHKTSGTRRILIEPSTVYPPATPAAEIPINRQIQHNGHANSYVAHIGTIGTLPIGTTASGIEVYGISFANLDYLYVEQDRVIEHGGGVLDLVLDRQNSDLLRPEIGIGLGFMSTAYNTFRFFGDFDVSYVRESRFAGKASHASFVGNDCVFEVNGLLPNQNLVCPSVRVGVTSSYGFDVALTYNGAIGTNYRENEGKIELTWVY